MKITKLHILLFIVEINFNSCEKPKTNPFATFTMNPLYGTTDSIFTFDASACLNKEDSNLDLQIRWRWEDNIIWV